MNILFFSQYYYPEQFLINEITTTLVKYGHKVTVVTGLPNYPSGVIEKEYKNRKKRRETIDGVDIVRCSIIPRGKNKLQLFANYFSYMFSAFREAKKLKDNYDIVVSYQLTPIFQVYPAIKYAKKNNLKLLMYNLDLAPMCGSGYGADKKLLFSWYSKFSKRIMNSCDHIAVTSESFIDYNNRVNQVPIEKMTYLPQHASDSMINMNMQSEDNGIVDFMFAGNIAGGTGLDTIVSAAKRLSKDCAFKIHIVGDGSYLSTLKKSVQDACIEEYFVFHGRIPSSDMPQTYKLADALLITLRPGQITVPAKLQMYMTTGKPIIGSMDGSGKDIINTSGCGVCVDAGDCIALYEKMKEFILSPEHYDNCGRFGVEYYKKHFTLDAYIKGFLSVIGKMKEI